eukprot:3234288-Amphidinium_carterae.1
MLPYDQSESWSQFLFRLLLRTIAYDRPMHTILLQTCWDGLKVRADGTYPLAAALKQARLDPFLMTLLPPMPRG